MKKLCQFGNKDTTHSFASLKCHLGSINHISITFLNFYKESYVELHIFRKRI